MIGFEEISLPVACLNKSGCKFSHFSGADSVSAVNVVYRYANITAMANCNAKSRQCSRGSGTWLCEYFLRAKQQGNLGLWHPVKDRECLFPAEVSRANSAASCSEKDGGGDPVPTATLASLAALALRERSVQSSSESMARLKRDQEGSKSPQFQKAMKAWMVESV